MNTTLFRRRTTAPLPELPDDKLALQELALQEPPALSEAMGRWGQRLITMLMVFGGCVIMLFLLGPSNLTVGLVGMMTLMAVMNAVSASWGRAAVTARSGSPDSAAATELAVAQQRPGSSRCSRARGRGMAAGHPRRDAPLRINPT